MWKRKRKKVNFKVEEDEAEAANFRTLEEESEGEALHVDADNSPPYSHITGLDCLVLYCRVLTVSCCYCVVLYWRQFDLDLPAGGRRNVHCPYL